MGFRRFLAAAALMVFGTGLMAGCPEVNGLVNGLNGLMEGLDELESDYEFTYAIPDGSYSGTKFATTTYWQAGEEYWSGDWDQPVELEFVTGEPLQPSGYWVDFGDEDSLDLGALQISRVVSDINVFDWGYEVFFDLTGTWDGVAFAGEQHVDYVAESDGSVTLYDTIELVSTGDGGEWEIVIEAEGLLTPDGGAQPGNPNAPSNPLDNPLLDLKSGKIRQ